MNYVATDNFGKEYEILRFENDIIIPKERISADVRYIDITSDRFLAQAGDDGYYVIADVEHRGSHLCRFSKKSDVEQIIKQDLMPIFGVKNRFGTFLGIVKGLKQNFYIVAGTKNGKYYLKLRFIMTRFGAHEDIKIGMIQLQDDADYCQMASVYREYQLNRGACAPLKERIQNNKHLEYAVHAPEIRIRLGWKPAPPTILEQTVENEPKMHVACTFERVMDIIDELKRQGVGKAQICLVGWNKSGHDGRYPQIFPVEEALGGEEKLKELIQYATDHGYQIVCHTNSTDCYSIADTFSEDIVCKKADGSLNMTDFPWSGGNMYNLCPAVALKYAQRDLPQIAALGFRGTHYIDVISVVPLRECYDKNHMCNKAQSLEKYAEIMQLCHENFGGFASEGAFDFAAKYLDYALYVAWSDLENNTLFDEEIPFWQLVYHGIILSNPSTATVNYTIKGEKAHQKLIEYSGRPSFYLYSKFMNGGTIDDWLGGDDLICDTDEQLRYSVSKIKEAYEEYQENSYLQLEYMTSHKKTEHGYEIEFSNGEKRNG